LIGIGCKLIEKISKAKHQLLHTFSSSYNDNIQLIMTVASKTSLLYLSVKCKKFWFYRFPLKRQ